MPKNIVKNMTVTRVSYSLIEVEDGVPVIKNQPDVVYPGVKTQEQVLRLLKAKFGKDALLAITKLDAGRHRFVMDWQTFALNAVTKDNEVGEDEVEDEAEGEEPEEEAEETEDAEAAEGAEEETELPLGEDELILSAQEEAAAMLDADELYDGFEDFDEEDFPF